MQLDPRHNSFIPTFRNVPFSACNKPKVDDELSPFGGGKDRSLGTGSKISTQDESHIASTPTQIEGDRIATKPKLMMFGERLIL